MKAIIKLVVPSYGFDKVEIEYHANPVGSKTLYGIDAAWQSYRGQRAKPINVQALLSFNSYEEIEEKIVAANYSSHRRGLEADATNPRIVKTTKKLNFKKTIPQ